MELLPLSADTEVGALGAVKGPGLEGATTTPVPEEPEEPVLEPDASVPEPEPEEPEPEEPEPEEPEPEEPEPPDAAVVGGEAEVVGGEAEVVGGGVPGPEV